MLSKKIEETIQRKYEQLAPYFNECILRVWAASEALSWGHGGITSVARATGLSRTTVHAGIAELEQSKALPSSPPSRSSIRRPGGGRKRLIETDPTLLKDLEFLVDPATRGDPESPRELDEQKHPETDPRTPGHGTSGQPKNCLPTALGLKVQFTVKSKNSVREEITS